MSLSLVADALHTHYQGNDALFTGVSTDTRTLKPGELFVALQGPNFDGHLFLAEAINAGAVGAIVSRVLDTALPSIRVSSTRLALGALAAFWRQQFGIPMIGVTGSNGKTMVKEMIASILGQTGPCWATEGNLNNDIGVPLTLLRLKHKHQFAVIEMGMNHRGEIAYLTNITRPTVALINNAAEAHLVGLGSLEAVARAKGEIFNGLTTDGVAVINADDAYAGLWREMAAPRRCLTFGLEGKADVTAEYESVETGNEISIKTPQGDITMRLPLLGKHNVMNSLAATSVSLAAGGSIQDIRGGLEKLKSVAGRLEVKQGINYARILDDTYNANPGSMAAGLQVLHEAEGERVLVLGDMAELGKAAADIHRRVGELARRVGVNRLFAMGKLSRHAVKTFGKGGRHFSGHQELTEALLDVLHGDMTVLVKGSRAMLMERVVQGVVVKQ